MFSTRASTGYTVAACTASAFAVSPGLTTLLISVTERVHAQLNNSIFCTASDWEEVHDGDLVLEQVRTFETTE